MISGQSGIVLVYLRHVTTAATRSYIDLMLISSHVRSVSRCVDARNTINFGQLLKLQTNSKWQTGKHKVRKQGALIW